MATLLRARADAHELLDGDRLDPRELAINLREMAMLNRLPGGVGSSVASVKRLLDSGSEPSVVDVGAGSGDFAARLRREIAASVQLVDIRPEILGIARRNLAGTDGVTFLHADARALPLPDASVDVAHASLLLHHLDPADAAIALREMRRVARRGVVVNDLRRGQLAFAATAVTVLALARGRWTRHDGVLSARRAYTLEELDALAADAGLALVTRRGAAWPRVTSVYR
ncbi:MAG TPA: methyltransferase domain-containing protein [Candidatus Limnocylindria bacterium]